jgi:hypothetical protein
MANCRQYGSLGSSDPRNSRVCRSYVPIHGLATIAQWRDYQLIVGVVQMAKEMMN